jgi:uncharacterized damage-inducible protein DinB
VIQDFLAEFAKYRKAGEGALAQVPDAALNTVPAADANSIAMIVRHISGNLRSRFTDFLTTDGEKPWRARDEEFVERPYTRAEITDMWTSGWRVVETEVGVLTDADLSRTVTIRGEAMTVHLALCRATAHMAYHVGQIVLLARQLGSGEWKSLSIPRGKSEEFNRKK